MKAVRNNTTMYSKTIQTHDLLIIDDIQFIKGKDRTMEEFFYLYTISTTRKKTADSDVRRIACQNRGHGRPSQIPFLMGLTLKPDPELKCAVAILPEKGGSAAGISIEDEAALFIANLIRSNA